MIWRAAATATAAKRIVDKHTDLLLRTTLDSKGRRIHCRKIKPHPQLEWCQQRTLCCCQDLCSFPKASLTLVVKHQAQATHTPSLNSQADAQGRNALMMQQQGGNVTIPRLPTAITSSITSFIPLCVPCEPSNVGGAAAAGAGGDAQPHCAPALLHAVCRALLAADTTGL